MKTIIAGSRDIPNPLPHINDAVLLSGFGITEIVSGTARGIDQAGELFGEWKKIPVIKFPANWDKHGKGAGYIRNNQMANYADALIAVWDGKSRGTKHMISEAEKKGLKVFVHIVKEQQNEQ